VLAAPKSLHLAGTISGEATTLLGNIFGEAYGDAMDKQSELEIVRRAYAKQILAAAGLNDPRLELAFASTRREDFLGPGPWQTFRGPGVYTPTPSADPIYLYTDNLIGIVPERGINNGQPTLHAILLANAKIQEGEHVVHVGVGTGYYTAIMAHLVGPSGRVTGIEFDAELTARSQVNLAHCQNVQVIHGNGAATNFDSADVIYINAGATRPAEAWLDGLSEAGRLILPLTTDASVRPTEDGAIDFAKMARRGAVFNIERRGTEFNARWICPAAYILAEGVRDKVSEAALADAFAKGDGRKVTRLYRRDDLPEDRYWLRGTGWCLAYE
jgi:protein-L-isoaspartate(D-aspartate) O-methyltransferase